MCGNAAQVQKQTALTCTHSVLGDTLASFLGCVHITLVCLGPHDSQSRVRDRGSLACLPGDHASFHRGLTEKVGGSSAACS